MSRDNPIWGALRVHGESLKLGITMNATPVGGGQVAEDIGQR